MSGGDDFSLMTGGSQMSGSDDFSLLTGGSK